MTQQAHEDADTDVRRQQVDDFVAWLDAGPPLRIAFRREHHAWFALAVDYDITGRGGSLGEAVDETFELVVSYLFAYFRDGARPEDAIRKVPWRMRATIAVMSPVLWIVHTISHKPATAGHRILATPSSAVRQLVAC